MAFLQQNFAPVGSRGADVPGFWAYKTTTDSQTAIQAAGYFAAKQNEMVPGDLIWAAALDGTVLLQYRGVLFVPVQVAPSEGGGGGPTAAIDVTYNNLASGLSSDNVQLALDEIDANVDANVLDIAANVADILTNSGLIATNTSDISTNSGLIATNTADIATSAGDILTNAGLIATNTGDISTNSSNISANASDIATNATNIAANTSAIGTIDTPIAVEVTFDPIASGMTAVECQSALEENHALIDINAADILTNTTDIGTNASGISLNTSNISLNTTAINNMSAAAVSFNPTPSNLLSTDTQAAIEEVNVKADAISTPTAAEVSFDPASSDLTAVTTQLAIEEVNAKTGGGGGTSVTQTLKNKLINGDFSIWQRGTTVGPIAVNAFLPDRWFVEPFSSTFTATRITGSVHDFALRVVCNTAAASGIFINQRIDVPSTIPAGQEVTVTAHVLATVDITDFRVRVQRDTGSTTEGGGNFTATGAVEEITFTYVSSGAAAAYWSLEIYGNMPATSIIELHSIQLEFGASSTTFDKRLPTFEKQLCLPYFERLDYPALRSQVCTMQAVSVTKAEGGITYSQKRMNPTLEFAAGSWINTNATGGFELATVVPGVETTPHGHKLITTTTNLIAGNATLFQNNAINQYIDVIAEV